MWHRIKGFDKVKKIFIYDLLSEIQVMSSRNSMKPPQQLDKSKLSWLDKIIRVLEVQQFVGIACGIDKIVIDCGCAVTLFEQGSKAGVVERAHSF